MFLESNTGGGKTILGVTEPFKINHAIHAWRSRRSSQVLHLTTAKPIMATVIAPFTAVMRGTRVDEGEFKYISPNKLLSLTNLTACSGISLHPDNTYAIPINYLQREEFIMTNVFGGESEP